MLRIIISGQYMFKGLGTTLPFDRIYRKNRPPSKNTNTKSAQINSDFVSSKSGAIQAIGSMQGLRGFEESDQWAASGGPRLAELRHVVTLVEATPQPSCEVPVAPPREARVWSENVSRAGPEVNRASSSRILRGARYGECLLHDLQRDVGDVETLVQLVGGVLQESIVGVSLRHHQVRGQRDL